MKRRVFVFLLLPSPALAFLKNSKKIVLQQLKSLLDLEPAIMQEKCGRSAGISSDRQGFTT